MASSPTVSFVDDEVASEKPKRKGVIGCFINNWFMITTIIGVAIGFGVGFGIQKIGLNDVGRTWLGRLNKARILKHVGCRAVIFLFL